MSRATADEIRSELPTGPFAPLRDLDFSSGLLGASLAHGANWMQTIAVPFLVFEMTGSATWLGVAAMASTGPSLLGAPLGGVWADRYSRRALLLWTLAAKSAVALGLYGLFITDTLTPLSMVGLLLISGFASSVNLSCWQPFVAQIAPERSTAAAYRLNAMQFNLSRAAGPALAGWVLAQWGAGTAFLVNALAYAPFAVVLLVIRPRPFALAAPAGVLEEFRTGVRAVLRHRSLGVPILTAAVLSVFGQSLHQLAAGLAEEVFAVGAQGFGLLISSVGVASLVGAAGIVAVGERVRRSRQALLGLFLYAAGILTVAATDVYVVGLVGFAMTGVAHVLVHISTTTAIQLCVSEELRGRVTSIYLMGIMAAMPMGALGGGFVADYVGLPLVVGAFGLVVCGYGVFAGLRLNGLRDLDEVAVPGPSR